MRAELTREHYMKFVKDLYPMVWNFVPAMASAAGRCGDEVADIRYALYRHIAEEMGHEKWVLEDAEAIAGPDFSRLVATTPPSWPIEALVAYNYHLIDRVHPVSVLGMVFVLELVSQRLAAKVAASVRQSLGLDQSSDRGVKFLSHHGTADQAHLREMALTINSIADRHLQQIVTRAVEVNFQLFAASLD
ncbi:MAG TPA: iron-containing redox enzyme family protein [Burkholderiaceae bacterium]